jgi:hypothetical protein|tara:strand:+ start:1258 stop:1530 length:273 start_codon:yes stop_codon:yes gene_type:complete
MIPGVFCDYIAYEIQGLLKNCIKEPQLNHHYFSKPTNPIIKEVGHVNADDSDYSRGPLTKTIDIRDVYGQKYKITIEDVDRSKTLAQTNE